MNGAGGSFSYPETASDKEMMKFACESYHGKGNCLVGKCACFTFWYGKGEQFCHCGKEPGQYEWVFDNRLCNDVAQDISGTVDGVGKLEVATVFDQTFVRRRGETCDIHGWKLVLREIGLLKLPSYHAVLDLRASSYEPGSMVWPSIVGPAAQVQGRGVHFDLKEQAFVFGLDKRREDVILAPVAAGPGRLPWGTWCVWAKVLRPNTQPVVLSSSAGLDGLARYYRTVDLRHLEVPANEWFHVAFAWEADPSTHAKWLSAFLNGRLVKTLAYSDNEYADWNQPDQLLIGGHYPQEAPSQPASQPVWISDVAIFNRALTADEVQELHATGRPSAPAGVAPAALPACKFRGNLSLLGPALTANGTGDEDALFLLDRYLECLLHNGEDADQALLLEVAGDALSCGARADGTNCSGAVLPTGLSLEAVCPRSCGAVSGLSIPGALGAAGTGAPFWNVTSGSCSAGGRCASSPFFPLMAEGGQTCELSAPPLPLSVLAWNADSSLEIEGETYADAAHEPEGIVPREAVLWNASGAEANHGWKFCSDEPSCGENCATSAALSCQAGVEACSQSGGLLSGGNASCADWRSAPHAAAASCEQSAWIQLDLGWSMQIRQVRLSGCAAERHCGRAVEISADGLAWRTAFRQAPGYGAAEPWEGSAMSFLARARHLRLWSSRGEAEPAARFLKVAVSGRCEDDREWRDHRYGDGFTSCEFLKKNPNWCWLRGLYSVEAQKACPQTCEACEQPFEELPGETCGRESLIDVSETAEHVESALGCYWFCLSREDCSDFEWQPGLRCSRFRGCSTQPLGNSSNRYGYSIAKKKEHYKANLEMLTWWSFVSVRGDGRCGRYIINGWWCRWAAKYLKLDLVSRPRDSDHGSGCVWNVREKTLRIVHYEPACTPEEQCICQERGAVVAAFFGFEAPRVHKVPTSDLVLPGDATTASMCILSQAHRCSGKLRKLRQLSFPARLGPKLSPFVADWDGDGDLDMIFGRGTGTLVYLENVAGILDWGNAIGMGKTTREGDCEQHWRSDKDGHCSHWCCHADGMGDICYGFDRALWAKCQPDTAWGVTADSALSPIAIDWDKDGDLDLFTATCDGELHFWRRTGRELEKVPTAENPLKDVETSGSCVALQIVDWDSDGDLDLLVGRENGRIDYYESVHGVLQALKGDVSPLHNVFVTGLAVPAAVDWDNDGDVDLIVGNAAGNLEYFQRSQHGSLVSLGPLPGIQVHGSSLPHAVDWDADGDTDLLVSDKSTGEMWLWVSEEDSSAHERLDINNPFSGLRVGRLPVPQVVDWDGNGLPDLIVGQLDRKVQYFEAGQDGTLRETSDSPFSKLSGLGVGPSQQAIDWDQDGDLDLLVGQADGAVIFYEQGELGQFSPGKQLLSSVDDLGTYLIPRAVDWDHDGDLDLVLGDSGLADMRSVRLAGFRNEDWNDWFLEQGPELTIGGREVFLANSSAWVLAYCVNVGYWFLFEDVGRNMELNRGGACTGAAARKGGYSLVDKDALGEPDQWEVHGTHGLQRGVLPEGIYMQSVVSDGTAMRPHCDTCTNREHPECGCTLSEEMKLVCAIELCQEQGFDTGVPHSVQPMPVDACSCGDNDRGNVDIFGAGCRDYQVSWCGHYDHINFNSSMCCACGGGVLKGGENIKFISVQAECYSKDVWLYGGAAAIVELLPEVSRSGTVRLFERNGTAPDALTERKGADNPFAAIKMAARPYPEVVDLNKDGKLDLVLGTESPDVATITSDGSPEKPFCAIWADDPCQWTEVERNMCGRGICQAYGYATGKWTGGISLCDCGPWPHGVAYNMYTGVVQDMKTNSRVVTITAECIAGGTLRYYEQQADGSLQEQKDTKNPFQGILGQGVAIPQVVDWDMDGEWELVLGDNEKIRFFELGEVCQQTAPCNGRGFCHPILGTCECIAGHTLSDCSSCEQDYYSQRTPRASVSTCLPCPGVGSELGLCAGRGLCMDDSSARLASKDGSNSTAQLAVGTGECACSPHYSGTDTLGRSSCAVGSCPAGQEPRLGAKNVKECSACPPGSSKDSAGNHMCGTCPRGTFSTAGAAECSPCPGGSFQSRAGQDSCQFCLPASYSENASSSCPSCPVGRFSDRAAMSECASCPPGHWSDTTGASQCTACPAGRYSSGLQPCQPCASGSFSELAGQGVCSLCQPGRYSAMLAASSGEECLACDVGRFSSAFGASSQQNCLACAQGATTAASASTDASLCVQPSLANFSCVSGRFCSVRLSGNRLQASHAVAIAAEGALVAISTASEDGEEYHWPQPLGQEGGTYELLWCPGIHGSCGSPGDFAFLVGRLDVEGPRSRSFACVRGDACAGLGPVVGLGLQSSDKIQVQSSCGSGPAVAISASNSNAMAMGTSLNADGSLTFGFGTDLVSANPNTAYQVCWCAMGRGQTGGCTAEPDFLTVLGSLRIEGPSTGHERICFLGQHCELRSIEGVGIKEQDRLMVLDECGGQGQLIAGVPGEGVAETVDGRDFHFLPLQPSSPKVLKSFPGLFRLCYCRPDGAGKACDSTQHFQADTGFFTAKGPYDDQPYGCHAGSLCQLAVNGVGLQSGDELEVQPAGATCEQAGEGAQGARHPAGFASSRAVASKRGKEYSFGALPANATPGKYQLCWRPAGSLKAFRASVGELSVTCPAGTFRLSSAKGVHCEECPFGFSCPGGSAAGGYVDDEKRKCATGRTTLSKGSTAASDCLCSAGFFMDEGGECSACPAGSFKSLIANSASCPGVCPEGQTSLPGASNAEHCFPNALSVAAVGEGVQEMDQVSTDIFVVEGLLYLPQCLPADQLQEAKTSLRQSIADTLRIQPAEVILEFPVPPPASCPTSRRLSSQEQGQPVVYKISKANEAEADRLSENINMVEIQAEVMSLAGIAVTVGTLPTVAKEVLNCSLAGPGMSFPLGSRPTSLAECTCSTGHERLDEGSNCRPCDIGLYKGTIGDVPCSLCSAAEVAGQNPVRLTTLVTGATGHHLCTCPPGYYIPVTGGKAGPPDACIPCGMGHYCPGGTARVQCPPGTTTASDHSGNVKGCICDRGFSPLLNANATHRCEPCEAGSYKVVMGDMMCTQKCPANSDSEPGATEFSDCFCKKGYFFDPFTTSCQGCPPDGVECPGQFDPPESREHSNPVSRAGFYMTGFASAKQCYIHDDDGASVCLPGASYYNSSIACAGHQTGIVCGACQHSSARDLGDQPCASCSDGLPDFLHVASLNLDLLIKAVFGIFLGKQAMDSATKSKKMEAVILRILLQWITACSVLSTFDLSAVEIFDWSQDQLRMKQNANSALVTATGLSFRFNFPEWFQPVWRNLMSVTGSIPSPISPQFSIECLVQRQMGYSEFPTQRQLLIPVLWWLFYPIAVMFWVGIVSLVIAKVAYPVVLWRTAKLKRRLVRLLTQAGVTTETATTVVDALPPNRVKEILNEPNNYNNPAGLVSNFSKDVFSEAVSSFLMSRVSGEFMEMLEHLCCNNEAEGPVVTAARQVVDGGLEFLSHFLKLVSRRISRSQMESAFSDPGSMPAVVLEALKAEGGSLLLEPRGSILAPHRISVASASSAKQVAEEDDESELGEEFGADVVPKDLDEDFLVFGLFQNTEWKQVLKDAYPLYVVTLYSIWDVVTQRMLGLVQVRTLLVSTGTDDQGIEQMEVQGRWLYDMRYTVFGGEHFLIGVIGIVGLSVWSIGLLFGVFTKLKRNRAHLQEKQIIRNYGYFYNGLTPNSYWWEVLIKKCDILCLYLVTFTELFHDSRAKLIMYLGFAGIFWAAHNMHHPYDDRQNRLADRIEDLGLRTRFITLFVLVVLLMLNTNLTLNAIMATFLVAINAWFLATIAFVLMIEIPRTAQVDSTGKTRRAGSFLRNKMSLKVRRMVTMGGANKFTRSAMRVGQWLVAKTIPILGIAWETGSMLATLKQTAATRVPHVHWQGVGLDLIVISPETDELAWYDKIFSFFVTRLYKLSEMDQKSFLAHTIGQFWDYVLTHSECHRLPSCIMDIFFALPDALRAERADKFHSDEPFHIRVGKRVHSALSKRKEIEEKAPGNPKCEFSRSTSFRKRHELPEYTSTGEDFNTGLLFIQRLPRREVHEFLEEAIVEDASHRCDKLSSAGEQSSQGKLLSIGYHSSVGHHPSMVSLPSSRSRSLAGGSTWRAGSGSVAPLSPKRNYDDEDNEPDPNRIIGSETL